MRVPLLVFVPGILLAQSEAPEEMHGAVGVSFSTSPRDRCMGTAWITNFGSRLWLTEKTGLRCDFGYQRFGLSDQLRSQIPSGASGSTEILSLNLNGVYRFKSGFYLQGGGGIYRRAVILADDEEDQDAPCHNRGGWDVGIGWESRSGFFVEISFHRIDTPGGPTDLMPIMVGSWF